MLSLNMGSPLYVKPSTVVQKCNCRTGGCEPWTKCSSYPDPSTVAQNLMNI